MQAVFKLGEHQVGIGTSLGIAMYPADCQDINTLLRKSDAAMYRAKEEGRNGFRFFTDDMQARTDRALALYTALGFALERGQDFDRERMPGPLGESFEAEGSFLWLCAQLYPSAFNRAPDTFTKHRAGLCALAPYAKPTNFYRLALPHIAPKLGAKLNVHHMPKKGGEAA